MVLTHCIVRTSEGPKLSRAFRLEYDAIALEKYLAPIFHTDEVDADVAAGFSQIASH